MIAAIKFEQYVIGASVFGVIVRKLSHQYKPGPVILLEVDKNLEISLYTTVLPLCLAVSLRLKRGG